MRDAGFNLPADLLQQDCDIIDEQDAHLVLTIRIAKATILKNHAILLALSEAASGSPWSPAADPPKPKYPTKSSWVYAGMMGVALLLLSPLMADLSWANLMKVSAPPVEIESVAPAKWAFKTGENIEIVIHYRRNRICQTTFDDLILPAGGGTTPVYNRRTYGASDTVLGEWKDFHLILKPPPLQPGDYVYTGYTHRECAQGGTYDAVYPNVPFTVVE